MHTTPRSGRSRPQRAMILRALLGTSPIGLPAAGQQPVGVKRDTGSVAPLFNNVDVVGEAQSAGFAAPGGRNRPHQ